MNARWTVPVAAFLAAVLLARLGDAAPATPPAANQTRATAGWYYVPGGWYMLVPAGPNAPAVASSATAGAQAVPAGLPATAVPTMSVPVFVAPSNVAPNSWQHGDVTDSDWPQDHGG